MYGRIQRYPETGWPLPGTRTADSGGRTPMESWKTWFASMICLTLFWLDVRAAALRTFWTAGSSRPMRTAMMAMTTNSSISVKPRRVGTVGREEWLTVVGSPYEAVMG